MAYRFKLLLITCLTCVCVAPNALAGMPSQRNLSVRGDRSLNKASEDPGASPIAPLLAAASPATTRPSPARPAGSPSPAQPAASPSASPTVSPTAAPATSSLKDWIWWGAIGIVPIGVLAAILYTLRPKPENSEAGNPKTKARAATTTPVRTDNAETTQGTADSQPVAEVGAIEPPEPLPLATPTRLARVDIIEALIHDLHQLDPGQRRKAIWELGQRGDSRAIQPLVDLLVDADSTQRGLILAAVTEISIRTLKPLNRALMLSMQDGSPDVRKNALRDVTRVFELVTQTSQLLQYAASDADVEVRETAEWAMAQLSRVRPAPGVERISAATPLTPSRLSSLAEAQEVALHAQEEPVADGEVTQSGDNPFVANHSRLNNRD